MLPCRVASCSTHRRDKAGERDSEHPGDSERQREPEL